MYLAQVITDSLTTGNTLNNPVRILKMVIHWKFFQMLVNK